MTSKQVLVTLIVGVGLTLQLAVSSAQSTDTKTQSDQVTRGLQVLLRLRAGKQPTHEELDLLEKIIRAGAQGPLPPFDQDDLNSASVPVAPITRSGQQNSSLSQGFSIYKGRDGGVYLYVVDLGSSNLRSFWLDRRHQAYGSIAGLAEEQSREGFQLKFAVNGGIFDERYRPKGLYLEQGKQLAELDTTRPGPNHGNFYLDPNGVFVVDDRGNARVMTTQRFSEEYPIKLRSGVQLAVQSGPALLVDGVVNTQFAEESSNLKRRTGVGVISEKRVVFAMSSGPISFFDFAMVFAKLGCRDALYLDGGEVGSFYSQDKVSIKTESPLVTMLGVVENTKKK